MRFRIAVALCLSAVLIVGAGVFKAQTGRDGASIVSVDRPLTPEESVYAEAYWPEAAPSDGSGTESLSTTDLISRQMLMDYLTLSSGGEIDQETIESLADTYVARFSDVNAAPRVSLDEIRVVSNAPSNFESYDKEMTRINNERLSAVNSAYRGESNIDVLGSGLYTLAADVSSAYEAAVEEMKGVPVPTALLSAHMKLLNNYLSTASGMEALAGTESDSMAAFAGMIAASRNMQEETVIAGEINAILIKNGI